MTIKILENLIIGDTEWKISPFKFNVSTLNFVGGGETPSYEDVVVSGTNSLTLANAVANSLSYLKLFGACEQASTPTPSSPVDIACNNGTIKVRDKELPSGYKRVKDIVYNNNSYFVTSYTMSGSDTMKVSFTKTASSACNLVGAYDGATPVDTNYSIYLSNLTNGKFLRYNGAVYNSYAIQDTRYDLTMTPTGSQGMEVDSTWEEKEFTSINTFCIGTTSTTATSAKFIGTIHGNIEIVNRTKFIPCERVSDSALGYYDTTAETFLENQGTGTLTTSGYDFDYLEFYVDGTAETVQMTYPDSTTSEAVTAQNLLGLGDCQDVQEVLTGHVIRKVGMIILTGEEDWTATSTSNAYRAPLPNNPEYLPPDGELACLCTHYIGEKPKVTISSMPNNGIKCGYKNAGYTPLGYIYLKDNSLESVSDVKDYLTQQYVNGTPVIVVYPLDVTTTETVTAHNLQVQEGDNVVTITQASINSLDMEAKYKKFITPEAEDIGELIISPVPLSNENYLELDGDLLTLTDAPELVGKVSAIYEDDPTSPIFAQESYLSTTWNHPSISSATSYGTISSTRVNSSHPAWKAFNGGKTGDNTKYYSGDPTGGDITWALPTAYKFSSCKVYQTDESLYLNRFPSYIKLYGSNDGTNYTLLGQKSGYSQPSGGGYVEVFVNNAADYTYYKWDFGAPIGSSANGVAIAEITIDIVSQILTPEQTWQSEVTTYGTCGQYVYDSENNTVRLPKYGDKLYTSGTSMDVYYYVRAK